MSYIPKDKNISKLANYTKSNIYLDSLQLNLPFNSIKEDDYVLEKAENLLWCETSSIQKREFTINHPELAKEYKKAEVNLYVLERSFKDPLIKFSRNIRSHMHRYLKGKKNKKSEEILGIKIKEFHKKIGFIKKGVHLDHIVPLSWAKTEDEIYCLNHYSNFQLLDAFENRSKCNRYCYKSNVNQVIEKHNNKALLQKILNRNEDKILKKNYA